MSIPKLPQLVAFIVRSWAIGGAIGGGLAAVLVLTDTGHLRTLIHGTSSPWAAILLLVFGFATLFAALYAATAIMLLPRDGQSPFGRDGDAN